MLAAAMAGFLEHGYDYIGMDHFALHDDALAIAKAAPSTRHAERGRA